MPKSSPSLIQLRQAIELSEEISRLEAELQAIFSGIKGDGELPFPFSTPAPADAPKTRGRKKRKKLSAEARARMAASAKARWAKKEK